jgi:class 3 adenylate cyclase
MFPSHMHPPIRKYFSLVVQIIDDDKGVHVVAAVNLYDSVPETSLQGLKVCQALVDQQVGCAIGMALGSTFCGVTGSGTVACRWDITGPPAVRAARLMQFALSENVEVAIDQSVYEDDMAATMMKELRHAVPLKGSAQPVVVYTLSPCSWYSAFRVLETVHGEFFFCVGMCFAEIPLINH